MTDVTEGFTFIWKIKNFSMLPHQKGEKLESPSFTVESLDSTKWHLWLYPKGDGRYGSDDHISLFLVRSIIDPEKSDLKLSFTLALESVNSEFVKYSFYKNIDNRIRNKGYGSSKFEELKFLHDNIDLYAPQDIISIGCHIGPSQENLPVIEYIVSNYFENRCSARTTVEVQRRYLLWPITQTKSQDKISINLENSLHDSPVFKLSYYVDKTVNDKHGQIEILQTRSSSTNQELFAKCKITVVSANKKHQTSREDYHTFSSNLDEIWHFPNFIIIDNIDEEYTYVDDTMYLQCEFAFCSMESIYHSELPMYMPKAFQENPLKRIEREKSIESAQLCKRMQGLHMEKKFGDVEIRIGEQSFPCHKAIICAQSPVISAMFDNDITEKKNGIKITDMEPQTLEKLLRFLYLEFIEEGGSVEELCKLYTAADKYEVLPLQRRCSLQLLSKLSVESICTVLVTAGSQKDHFLWTNVCNFLSINSFVFCSREWKNFMIDHPVLSRETMVKICMEKPLI